MMTAPSSGQPLAEVFGSLVTDMSGRASGQRSDKLCPFNNKVRACTKDKVDDPLGVCTIMHEARPVITCPIRFRENWLVVDDAAGFLFPEGAAYGCLSEVRLRVADDSTAGNIDFVLVQHDEKGKISDFGALEIQAVYISGNVRDPFLYYMEDPGNRSSMDWSTEPKYPRPDYLSSSRKRRWAGLKLPRGIL